MRSAPYLEAGVAGPEIEFLLIPRAIGDMALAVDAGDLAFGADHREAVVEMRSVGLEEAGRDPDLQLLRQFLHREHRRMFRRGARIGEQALVLDPAEIGTLEQLGRKHDLGALARRLAHQPADRAEIRDRIVGEGELQRSNGELAHAGTCCEMQWKLPPPVRMWSARSPIATRSGNSAWTTSTAPRSLGAPYCGTMTTALPM